MADRGALIEIELNRVNTNYREAPKLLHLMRTLLGQVADVILSVDEIPSFFDIDTAVGDQLTKLGQRIGWLRCHCVCNTQPVFGFDCDGTPTGVLVAGFCDEAVTWEDCGPFGSSDICLNDDTLYRAFLKVRRYQMLALYDLQSLTECVKLFWGDTAMVMDEGRGRVVVAPGRQLSNAETAVLQLYPRVLPLAPGVNVRFHFGSLAVFGFGEGWGGFCSDIFSSDAVLATEQDFAFVTETGDYLGVGEVRRDAEWMCEIDVHPYNCAA